MTTGPFQIGVDGGGTKTECILIDGAGEIVARHSAPGSNPSLVGADCAAGILREALRALLAGPPPRGIERTLLCVAGSRAFWQEQAAALSGCGRVEAVADSLPVLELATHGGPGLVLHAGTGSFVAARAPDGSLHYAGGLGWRFGDPGSGHDLGRRGIARALLELQGSTEPSALTAALQQHTGLAGYAELSRRFYLGAEIDAVITAFAPVVVDLAGRGCAPAKQIVAASLAGLGGLVAAVLRRHFPGATPEAPVAGGISGLLLNRPPCLEALRALAATHAWPLRLDPVDHPPIEGVRRLLLRGG
ncbi:MAG TPA: BadF/BadG/BcrA/BcrD ATPase family protein [Opitutaceae bacterium]|nr:BadF/BadG/BcrA/BcrD ATPase family protein [Opitutaceae bacterium]